MLRKRLEEIQAQTEAEKQWWEKRRASIQSEFMKELEKPSTTPAKAPTSKAGSEDDAIMVETPVVNGTGSLRKKKGKK